MSVIGRLDDQVNAVLIAPLKKGRGQKTETPQPQQDSKENDIAEASSETSTPAEAIGGKVSEDGPSTDGRDRLPVWLL
ncbi:MAG TPA: hypothetical protein VE842_09755 [Pyrinomonadaceae bacterium]|jgi:hypothetical protein|nr:hypothetical protein [Pyrinomonadaceae bacterium]